DRRACLAAVAIRERILRIVKLLDVQIGDIRIVYRVAPTQKLIVPDSRESGAEERRAAQVPAFVAVEVSFVPLAGPEERLLGIDEKHRVAVRSLLWSDR